MFILQDIWYTIWSDFLAQFFAAILQAFLGGTA